MCTGRIPLVLRRRRRAGPLTTGPLTTGPLITRSL